MNQTIKGHLWGLNSTLTSNEQNKISKKGRQPKSVSPSIKVIATGKLDLNNHIPVLRERAPGLQDEQYTVIMVANYLSV